MSFGFPSAEATAAIRGRVRDSADQSSGRPRRGGASGMPVLAGLFLHMNRSFLRLCGSLLTLAHTLSIAVHYQNVIRGGSCLLLAARVVGVLCWWCRSLFVLLGPQVCGKVSSVACYRRTSACKRMTLALFSFLLFYVSMSLSLSHLFLRLVDLQYCMSESPCRSRSCFRYAAWRAILANQRENAVYVYSEYP